MNIASAISGFEERWNNAAGGDSGSGDDSSPEIRRFRRMICDLPVVAVRRILEGTGIARDGAAGNGEAASGNAAPLLPAIAPAFVFCVFAAPVAAWMCDMPGWLAACLASSASAALAFALCRRRYAKDRREIAASRVARDKAGVSVSRAAVEKAVDEANEVLSGALACVKKLDEDSALGFDVTDSEAFGEWVQKFVDCANETHGSQDIRILKDELVSKLRTMGITVYDKIKTGRNGEQILPGPECFRDERGSEDDAFSNVRHAVVSSRRRVLAVGELA